MCDPTLNKVVVCVEGSASDAASDAALRVAAAQARGRRCGVHLLHVVTPVYASRPEVKELTAIALRIRKAGEAVLSEAHHHLVRLLGEDADSLPVSTELCHGAVVPAIVAASAHAQVVVLQHHGMGAEGQTRKLSTTLGVAARVRVPVLAVPDGWGAEPSPEPLVVTAGVVDAATSMGVARTAVREADRIGARVCLLHASNGSLSASDVSDADVADPASRLRRLERELWSGLVEASRDRPHVLVEVEVTAQAPEVALLEHARGSSLLVVGRHHSRVPWAPRLGHVVRTVLRHATCPVLVVEAGPPTVPRQRDLATAAIP